MASALTALGSMPSLAHAQIDKGDAKIAEEAFIYGFPMVMNCWHVHVQLRPFAVDKLTPDEKTALETGMKSEGQKPDCSKNRSKLTFPVAH
jgi:hypothetical protein